MRGSSYLLLYYQTSLDYYDIEYPGAWYHVMNYGRWAEKIFLTAPARETFLKK